MLFDLPLELQICILELLPTNSLCRLIALSNTELRSAVAGQAVPMTPLWSQIWNNMDQVWWMTDEIKQEYDRVFVPIHQFCSSNQSNLNLLDAVFYKAQYLSVVFNANQLKLSILHIGSIGYFGREKRRAYSSKLQNVTSLHRLLRRTGAAGAAAASKLIWILFIILDADHNVGSLDEVVFRVLHHLLSFGECLPLIARHEETLKRWSSKRFGPELINDKKWGFTAGSFSFYNSAFRLLEALHLAQSSTWAITN